MAKYMCIDKERKYIIYANQVIEEDWKMVKRAKQIDIYGEREVFSRWSSSC